MNGILVVDKPQGWTSFDVIAKLRGALATRKLGHMGTLDPMATGVLPIFVGPAARAVDLQPDHSKEYVATLRLGLSTDTGDITGAVLRQKSPASGAEDVKRILPRFLGPQLQTPPMYSAVKIGGVKLVDAARRGREIERPARPITIDRIDFLDSPAPHEYRLRVGCSKGTYIRVLVQDIAAALGEEGTLSALRRTRAGVFTEAVAHPLPLVLERAQAGQAAALLQGADTVFAALPALAVTERTAEHLFSGCPTSHYPAPDGEYRVYREGSFLGLAAVEEGVLRVKKLFVTRE